jgi:hypothetical protein
MNWKVPLWMAGIGVAICVASLAYIQLDLRFNLFHNPTSEQAESMGSYSEPFAQEIIDYAIPILTPGTLLLVGFKEVKIPQGEIVLYFALWAIAAVVNAALYGLIGLILANTFPAKRQGMICR